MPFTCWNQREKNKKKNVANSNIFGQRSNRKFFAKKNLNKSKKLKAPRPYFFEAQVWMANLAKP